MLGVPPPFFFCLSLPYVCCRCVDSIWSTTMRKLPIRLSHGMWRFSTSAKPNAIWIPRRRLRFGKVFFPTSLLLLCVSLYNAEILYFERAWFVYWTSVSLATNFAMVEFSSAFVTLTYVFTFPNFDKELFSFIRSIRSSIFFESF